MNKTFKLMTLALALVISLSSTTLWAKSDKTVNKARTAVENASPDDWETYAKSAQMLIKKNANMSEAKMWIEKSISIRETAFNLEVFGDYYIKNNVPKKATQYYLKSMGKLREKNPTCDVTWIQAKVISAGKMQ